MPRASRLEIAKFVDTRISKSIAELLSKRDHRTLVLWAADCAEHVLIFRGEVPERQPASKSY